MCSEHVKKNSKIPGQDFEYTVLFVPRRTLVCEKILEDEGVLGDVTIGEFPLHFLALEPDLLSLELDDSFEELYLVCFRPFLMGNTISLIHSSSVKIILPYFIQPVHSWVSNAAMVFSHA